MTKLLVKNPTRTLQGVELALLGVGEVKHSIESYQTEKFLGKNAHYINYI